MLPGTVIPGRLPRQGSQPPCLLRTDSVSPGPWEPLGSCILLPSPGTAAGPGVSTGLLSTGFPGQQGKAGCGERWLCWVFWVGCCPVCVLPLDSQDVGAHTPTVLQFWRAEFSSTAVWTAWLCQAGVSLACSDLTPESTGAASPQAGTSSMETSLVQDFYPFQVWLWSWAVAADHTSMSGSLTQGMLCLGLISRGAKVASRRVY